MGTKQVLQELTTFIAEPFYTLQVPIVVTDNQAYYFRVTGKSAHHEQVKHLRRRFLYSNQLFRFGDVNFAQSPGKDMLANQGTKADLLVLFKAHTPVCLGHVKSSATLGDFAHLSVSNQKDLPGYEMDAPPIEVWLVRQKYHHIDCPTKPDHDADLLVPISEAVSRGYVITCACRALFGQMAWPKRRQ
jgi:hypothetical protein